MPDGPALSKHTLFGFGIQTAQGTPQTVTIEWTPFSDSLTLGPAGENELYRQADLTDWVHEVVANGEWQSGDVPMTLRPTSSFLTAFASALQDRDASYNQGKFLTCYIVESVGGAQVVHGIQDCKIVSASFTLEKGSPVALAVTITGLAELTGHGVTPSIGAGFGPPYLWKSSIIRADFGGSSYKTAVNMERSTINFNNNVEDAQEGHRLGSGLVPRRLWNIGAIEADGTFSRDFINYKWYDLYYAHLRNGPDSSTLAIQWIFSGTSTLTITAPRLSIRNWPRSIEGSNVGRQVEEISFDCLGTRNGVTAPVTLAVS